MFEKDLSLSVLYDAYSSVLSENKREVFEAYYLDDLSLSEIAEKTGTTRQAVRDLILRTEKALRGYEDKLGLVSKRKKAEELLDRLASAGGEEKEEIIRSVKELL